MAYLDKVMDDIKSDENTNSEEVGQETPNTQENVNKNESQDAQPIEEKTRVDKSKISDVDKATYSLKKQMAKQKARYESQLSERQKEFDELKTRLERLENPQGNTPKQRDSFKTDDEYIDYIVQSRMDKILSEKDKEYAKQRKSEEENFKRSLEISERIEKCFPTEKERNDYVDVVQSAFDNGLEELMDKEQFVSQYIQSSPNGPRLLYDLATKPELVKTIFSQGDPLSRILEIKLYEKELGKGKQEAKTPTANVDVSKVIGKPGLSTGKNTTDLFTNPDELRNFIRRR